MEYTFDTSGSVLDHREHNWEEWHAYLAADMPEWVQATAQGFICHDCHSVTVEINS